ncbi:hypothetical protein LA303_13125 [Candidatus Sulfidibacterium hydrothermale]|uniref:hypothetical protein n=1 Tax=Candidatus Sulfidibacterium hydrothermale TaxID=2875962 RepID=UPI001F0A8ACF|nr:hypothetical protein [Candidatus Sulfidibacterium hydrothermale]UBM62322.1 hypothetical protein LA303_13125 [Candidatus Sulfidibacterium hydrothermale]
MKDKIAIITRWILYVLLVLAVIPGVAFYAGVMSTDTFLNWGKFMLILGVAVIILAPIYTIIVNPKNLVKMLISIVILAVILGVSYSFATNQLTPLQLETYKITPETSKLVGMGLIASYITFGLSIIAILYSGVVKIFK